MYHLVCPKVVNRITRWGYDRNGVIGRLDRESAPLCGRALEILDEARKLVEGNSPFLFPNRVGKQLEEKQLRRMFRKHGIAAVPHGFRSSFRD